MGYFLNKTTVSSVLFISDTQFLFILDTQFLKKFLVYIFGVCFYTLAMDMEKLHFFKLYYDIWIIIKNILTIFEN